MPEFRSLFDLPPSILNKADLFALASLLEDGVPISSHSIDYIATSGEASYKAKSITELLNQLPDTVEEVDFRVTGWSDDRGIDRGVSVRLHSIVASCQIHSMDEVWYRGKIAQINRFFGSRAPWYAIFRPYMPVFSGMLQPILLLATGYLWVKGNPAAAVVAGLTFVAFAIATVRFIRGKLLPMAKIILADDPSWLTKESAMLFFTALGAVGTLLGVILQVWPRQGP